MLVNVVIGVLLERFLMTMTLSRVQVEQEEVRSSGTIRDGPLDKIMEVASCFPVAHMARTCEQVMSKAVCLCPLD